MQLELCFLCDEPTGRAGRLDDSIYSASGKGPFCWDCWSKYCEQHPEENP
jgi:hypothetical protein